MRGGGQCTYSALHASLQYACRNDQPALLLHCAATNALVGAYVLAFISCGLELAVAVAMIANRKSFDERECAHGAGTVGDCWPGPCCRVDC